VYSTYGLTGSGIKVGVISDGMNYWQASSSNGDLPTFVYAVDNTNNTTNYPGSEGTAMMEIIHDIAPYAELWFGGIADNDNHLDFADRVTHLKQQGCKVIVDDVGMIIGYSYFQENEISTAIRQFIQNNNGCYISACGNNNSAIYSGTNYTVDTDNFLKFNGSTKELLFTANYSGQFQITFQWADDWFYPVDDYDLYVYDNNNQLILTSENRSPNFPSEEYGGFDVSEGSTYKIKIKWYDYVLGSSNREIKILLMGDDINMPLASTEKQIFGHPITSEVISTAATDVTDPLNVESFSSRGPAIVYSSGSGTTTSIQQPKITAADGVETYVGQTGNFGNPFFGTSAAAPHVAGIAALYYEGFPTDGYSQFLTKIKSTSITMNDGGSSSTWSKVSGFGRVDAYSAIAARVAENYVNVTVNQRNSQETNVGTADVWQSTSWQNFAVPKSFIYAKNSTQVLRSNQAIINNEKYRDWNNSLSDVTNHKSFTITPVTTELTAHLLPTNNVQIKNALEGTSVSGGKIGFKDPWLIDDSDTKGPKNRGTIASALWYDNLTSPFTPGTSSNYKGVFLDQDPAETPTYYTVRVTSPQTINVNGTNHTFYFQNWNATPLIDAEFQNSNSTETAVVFKNANVAVNANLKGTQLSNNAGTLSNNNQRKFIKVDGKLYLVYESMDRIWLERSSDNGSTWEILNNADPVDIGYGKFSSLASWDTGNESLFIIYHESAYGNQIRAQFWQNGSKQYDVVVADVSVSQNSVPVAAYNYNGRLIVVWDNGGDLYYRFGNVISGDIQWYNSVAYLTGPNAAMPTITKDAATDFYLAWQDNWSSIKYCKLDTGPSGSSITATDNATISTGCGYPTNYFPNITTLSSGQPKVVWIGSPYYGSSSTKVITRSKGSSSWNSYFGQYGSFVYTPQINMGGTTDIISWTENNGAANKLLKEGSIKNFNTTGVYIQLCNSSSIYSMYGLAQNNQSIPYSFNRTNSVGSISKESDLNMNNGRGIVVTKDKNEFYFILGDVSVNGELIKFEELPENLFANKINDLNNYLLTKPFELKDESVFELGVFFGVTDSAQAKLILNKNDKLSFSFELISARTNEVIGKYEKFIFKKNVIRKASAKTFSINGNGIGNETVRLKISVETNFESEYTLLDILNDSSILPKMNNSASEEISYAGLLEVSDYHLSQNYPNPFNPSTVINYQILDEGFVTLKIYDILGKEVATLVNEQKSKGMYNVTFNASSLVSGVYIYSLRVNDYKMSKKMVLLR